VFESLFALGSNTQVYVLLACTTQVFIFEAALQHVLGMGIACKNL